MTTLESALAPGVGPLEHARGESLRSSYCAHATARQRSRGRDRISYERGMSTQFSPCLLRASSARLDPHVRSSRPSSAEERRGKRKDKRQREENESSCRSSISCPFLMGLFRRDPYLPRVRFVRAGEIREKKFLLSRGVEQCQGSSETLRKRPRKRAMAKRWLRGMAPRHRSKRASSSCHTRRLPTKPVKIVWK